MRTKSYLVSAFILLSNLVLAQFPDSYYRFQSINNPNTLLKFPVSSSKQSEYILEREIEKVQVTKTSINKKGKVKPNRYMFVYSLDDLGLVSLSETYKKGEKRGSSIFTYKSGRKADIASAIALDKNGEISSSRFHWSADSGRASEYLEINKKGDTTFRSVVSNINNLQSTDRYYKNGKLKKYWESEYYENKSLKKTTFYNAKGKEKYIWDYQCKEEGIEIKKQKDTTTRCVSVEKDNDGITTYIYHTVNEKGELFKTINKQNSAGKFFYYKRTKGPKDIILYEQVTTYAADDSTRIGYKYKRYKKGIMTYAYDYSYDMNGNETARIFEEYKKGELIKKTTTSYEYDDKNRPIKRITSDSLTKEQDITEFAYDF